MSSLNTDQVEKLAEAVDKQFPDHWLNADAVKALSNDELVDLELPLWFVRQLKAWMAAKKTERAQAAANQYQWTL
jgi:hypothetical protein